MMPLWCNALCDVAHPVSFWISFKSLALEAVSSVLAALLQHVYGFQAGAGSQFLWHFCIVTITTQP